MTTVGTSTTIDTGRAIMAALQPLTGKRAAGILRLRSKAGTTIDIPRNFYWMPVVSGQRITSWLFKATEGPNEDKGWTVNDSGDTLITIMSNAGGTRHNVDAGTGFQPATPIDDLVIVGSGAPVAEDDFEGGVNPVEFGGVMDMALFETFDGPAMGLDLHRSPIDQFPAILLAFQTMEPADGVAIAQNNQMAINAGTDTKFYKVSYTISCITEIGHGDANRRAEGLLIADTVMQLLNDKHAGDEGECLSNPGGMQVRQMVREQGPQDIYQKFYIYTVLVSAMVTLERLDFRVYHPWLRTSMAIDKPQLPELPGQGTIRLIDDAVIDMTPNSLDLATDGIFTRSTTAYLWVPGDVDGVGALQLFAVNERRVTNASLGVLLESVTSNDLGAQGEDLTGSGWATSGGASVTADTEVAPSGATTADEVDFPADADAYIQYADADVTTVGEPIVMQVFAKAPGTKFTTRMRMVVVDSSSIEHFSDDIEVGPSWDLYRFEVTLATAGDIELRIYNASDAVARQVMVWGVYWNQSTNFWGAQYTPLGGTKTQDSLVFLASDTIGQPINQVTPATLLTGTWRLRFLTPEDVLPDVIGTDASATTRVLVSIGDGVDDLVSLTLIGTPATGGAALALNTRGDGNVISIDGLEWVPGAELAFTIDAIGGQLTVAGTLNGDGSFDFPGYSEDAVAATDVLVIGEDASGTTGPTPGKYVAIDFNI